METARHYCIEHHDQKLGVPEKRAFRHSPDATAASPDREIPTNTGVGTGVRVPPLLPGRWADARHAFFEGSVHDDRLFVQGNTAIALGYARR